jgi:hypothetical protein
MDTHRPIALLSARNRTISPDWQMGEAGSVHFCTVGEIISEFISVGCWLAGRR